MKTPWSALLLFSLSLIITQYWNIHQFFHTRNGNFLDRHRHLQSTCSENPSFKKLQFHKHLHIVLLSERLLQNRHDSRPSFIWSSEIRAVLLVSSGGSSQRAGLQVRCCSSTVRALKVAEHNTGVCPLEASPGHQPVLLAFRPEISE